MYFFFYRWREPDPMATRGQGVVVGGVAAAAAAELATRRFWCNTFRSPVRLFCVFVCVGPSGAVLPLAAPCRSCVKEHPPSLSLSLVLPEVSAHEREGPRVMLAMRDAVRDVPVHTDGGEHLLSLLTEGVQVAQIWPERI